MTFSSVLKSLGTLEIRKFIIINFMVDKIIQFQLRLNHTMRFFFLILITKYNLNIQKNGVIRPLRFQN